MLRWIKNKITSFRVRRAKNRIIASLESIAEYDDILRRAGCVRHERRQFWRDIVNHPEFAKKIASNFKEA